MIASRSTTASPSSELEADPKLNHLVAAQLCKTKMCAMYARGSCNDSKCRFAHSSKELRTAPDLSKTAICRAFARGQCRASMCKFAHGEQELRVTPTVYKTQICNFFEQGYCKKGADCRHAHGVSELRSFQGSSLTAQQNPEVSYEPSVVAVGPPARGSPTKGREAELPRWSGAPGGKARGKAPREGQPSSQWEAQSRPPKGNAYWGAGPPSTPGPAAELAMPLTPPASQPRRRPSPPAGPSTPERPERSELRQPAGFPWPGRAIEISEPMKVQVPELGLHRQRLLHLGPPAAAGAGLGARDGDVAAAAMAAALAAREHTKAANAASEMAAKLAVAAKLATFRQQQGGTPPSRDGLLSPHELGQSWGAGIGALLGGGAGQAPREDGPARVEGSLPVARALSFTSPPETPRALRLTNRPSSPWHPGARSSSNTWVV